MSSFIALFGAGAIYLGKTGALTPGYALTVRFPDAQGVAAGTPVRMAGVAIGSVTRAALTGQAADVSLSIHHDSQIPRGSRFVIASPQLDPPGGVRVLPPLVPDGSGGVIAPGAAGLVGESGVDLAAALSQASLLMARLDQTSRRTDGLLQNINAVAANPQLRRDIAETTSRVRVMSQDGAQITRQLKAGLPQTQARAQTVLKNAAQATVELTATVRENRAQMRGILTDVRRTTSAASDLTVKTSKLLQSPRTAKTATEMTENLRSTLGSLKSASEHLDTLTANGAKLSDDPAVQADLKSTLHSLAQSTDKAAVLLDKGATLVDLLTKAAQAKNPNGPSLHEKTPAARAAWSARRAGR